VIRTLTLVCSMIWVAKHVGPTTKSREEACEKARNHLNYMVSEIRGLKAETGRCEPDNSMIVAWREPCKDSSSEISIIGESSGDDMCPLPARSLRRCLYNASRCRCRSGSESSMTSML
jgi:hypothetical protein